jgi:GAF domain-containing protein
MPLYSLGQWQGMISAEWYEPKVFLDEEIFVLDQIVEPVAASIASKRLLTQTEELYQIGSQLNRADTFASILQVVCNYTRIGSQADFSGIFYFDEPWTESAQPSTFEIVASLRQGKIVEPEVRVFPASTVPRLLVERRNEVIVIPNVETHAELDDVSRKTMLEVMKARAIIYVPLIVGNNWVGSIAFYYHQPMQFSIQGVKQMQPVAEQAAVALQGVRFLRETEIRAQREQKMREIATKVRSSTNVETIMRTAVREIGEVLGRHSIVYLEKGEQAAQTPEQQESTVNG